MQFASSDDEHRPAGAGGGSPRPFGSRRPSGGETYLRDAWRGHAAQWTAWARAPMHDSYWRFHRDQFCSLLPEPRGLTLDIGAGEGRLTRHLSERGYHVVALDAAPAMALAAHDAEPTTRVVIADAAALPFADGIAELAVAFMSLHDIDDLAGAVHEVARVLRPGGHLCAAIVHPINSAGRFDGVDADARFVIDGSYLRSTHYRDEVARDGLEMTFVSAHRPLEVYTETLFDAGFLIEHIREPAVPDKAVRADRDRRWQRVPGFLHVRAVRPSSRGRQPAASW